MELQIEAPLEEMITASKDYDELTNGLIISSYFLEIGATSFFKEEKMTAPANEEDQQETNQIVE